LIDVRAMFVRSTWGPMMQSVAGLCLKMIEWSGGMVSH